MSLRFALLAVSMNTSVMSQVLAKVLPGLDYLANIALLLFLASLWSNGRLDTPVLFALLPPFHTVLNDT